MNKKTYTIIFISAIIFTTIIIFLAIKNTGAPKEASLTVNSNGDVTTETYKKGDIISCNLLGTDYQLTIEDLLSKVIKFQVNSYGLAKQQDDGTVDINTPEKEFILTKGKELILAQQSTDIMLRIAINWN